MRFNPVIDFCHPIANSPFVPPPPPPPDSRGPTPTPNGENASRTQARQLLPGERGGDSRNERQVAQRSRWQAMLLEAGGLSAALSEESMRRLKYCLQWLQVTQISPVRWTFTFSSDLITSSTVRYGTYRRTNSYSP